MFNQIDSQAARDLRDAENGGAPAEGETLLLPRIERGGAGWEAPHEQLSEADFLAWMNARAAIWRVEGQLQQAQQAQQALVGDFWQRYKLGGRDEIKPNGTIVRVEPSEELNGR